MYVNVWLLLHWIGIVNPQQSRPNKFEVSTLGLSKYPGGHWYLKSSWNEPCTNRCIGHPVKILNWLVTLPKTVTDMARVPPRRSLDHHQNLEVLQRLMIFSNSCFQNSSNGADFHRSRAFNSRLFRLKPERSADNFMSANLKVFLQSKPCVLSEVLWLQTLWPCQNCTLYNCTYDLGNLKHTMGRTVPTQLLAVDGRPKLFD